MSRRHRWCTGWQRASAKPQAQSNPLGPKSPDCSRVEQKEKEARKAVRTHMSRMQIWSIRSARVLIGVLLFASSFALSVQVTTALAATLLSLDTPVMPAPSQHMPSPSIIILASGSDTLPPPRKQLPPLPAATERLMEGTGMSIDSLRRVRSEDGDYSFRIPDGWEVDPLVLVERQKRRETPSALLRPQSQGLPDSAYFSKKRRLNNLSVIKSNVEPGFALHKILGTPSTALERLSQSLAPPGSGKTITNNKAYERTDANGNLEYVFEYTVSKETWKDARHTFSLIACRPDQNLLYTATIVIAESDVKALQPTVDSMLDSFVLL